MNGRSLVGPIVRSAIFIVVTVLATAVLALSIAQPDSGAKDKFSARFTNASGLRVGDTVRIAGVQVGQVDQIKVVDKRLAQVRFTVAKGRRLPLSTTATIKYLNLVGQRFLELGQGTGDVGDLKPGSVIPVEQTRPALDMTELFNGFRPLFQALSPEDVNELSGSIIQVFQGEGGSMETLLTTLGSLSSTIAGRSGVIGQVIDNLTAVLDAVNSRGDAFGNLIGTMDQLVKGLAADRKPIGDAIDSIDDLAVVTAGLLEEARAPLKQDIYQLGKLSKNLADHSPKVDQFLKQLPVKLSGITRLGTYGSWLNFFVCEADVKGIEYKDYPGETSPLITGIPNTATRCTS
ncbi:MlaD family protein [Actinocorallia lasiicapitis]